MNPGEQESSGCMEEDSSGDRENNSSVNDSRSSANHAGGDEESGSSNNSSVSKNNGKSKVYNTVHKHNNYNGAGEQGGAHSNEGSSAMHRDNKVSYTVANDIIEDIDELIDDDHEINNDNEYGEHDEVHDERWAEFTSYEEDNACQSNNVSNNLRSETGEAPKQDGGSSVGTARADGDQRAVGSSGNITKGDVTYTAGSMQLSAEGVAGQNSRDSVVQCPGKKRRLTTLSQWSRDARIRMLDALQFDHGVT